MIFLLALVVSAATSTRVLYLQQREKSCEWRLLDLETRAETTVHSTERCPERVLLDQPTHTAYYQENELIFTKKLGTQERAQQLAPRPKDTEAWWMAMRAQLSVIDLTAAAKPHNKTNEAIDAVTRTAVDATFAATGDDEQRFPPTLFVVGTELFALNTEGTEESTSLAGPVYRCTMPCKKLTKIIFSSLPILAMQRGAWILFSVGTDTWVYERGKEAAILHQPAKYAAIVTW